ncbi:DNA helicase-2/ATP-dependent DNA helicase PcrA [Leucobacter luti]|uniref:ATP-dependent DNA helicase n=1 Tax=Leucobacter luti TaxID=340320 RepID=UPI001051C58B|nr:ATP-dependent DNA helicase [Leucobacter luti]MCW2287474.1 DNA helicase-2/ATP-dependent DNA helicase PcrA [Leucobacter luti]TCK41696.1 DNA helicase-2/ATP-dependent DNA helicase PcrA [Leucobacter luti]
MSTIPDSDQHAGTARETQGVTPPVFAAARIAELLAVPPAPVLTPTPEQQAVIEQPLGGSTLVVAGAGSGKTETMANRVVWLVANELVAPDTVLGLTFTRKAAGELRERITGRLAVFIDRLRDAAERGTLAPAEFGAFERLDVLLADGLDIPEVSTYNSFAAGVLQEFGIAAGVAPGAAVIDEATAWRLARDVVIRSADSELAESDMRIPELIRHILSIDHAVADNLTSLDRVDQVVSEFGRVIQLPYNEKELGTEPSGRVYAPVRDAVAALTGTPLITRLAREYAAAKEERGLIEFPDQLALATRALEHSPDAIAALRRRHRAVLLDEVQDTSVGQTRFLSMIFSGSSVMAVGDPHQSIYGWRGASAEGLRSFHTDFAPRGRALRTQHEAPATLTLSTSWRNPSRVLDAANTIAGVLAETAASTVPKLTARPGAGSGTVEWAYPETVHEERLAVAEWMRDARVAHLREHGELPSAAVIFRTRKHMAAFSAALSDVGVPNRIVGLGGLLTTPEVTDVVCTLRALWYADAGGELIRLLAGPRFRVGVADLAGLKEAARWFGERDLAQQPLSEADRVADQVLPDPDRQFTLLDALDQIAHMRELDHRALRSISVAGRERLSEAGRMLASLRTLVGGDIGELIGATVQALRLDIELDANEQREHAGTSAAHANLDLFGDLVDSYLAIDTRGTLASVLEWIERAIETDESAEHVAAPVPGTVHLITAHGSKGLEWDLVVVPRLVVGEFPGSARAGAGWLRTGQIPDELRGDAAARPELNWRIADTQDELRGRIAEYKTALKERHAEEERRLAYVAITRSADRLLLTGSFWGGQTRARVPSVFLTELGEAGIITGLPVESAHETDPSVAEELVAQWPLHPLGAREGAVLAAAEVLRTALAVAQRPDASDVDRERPPHATTGNVADTLDGRQNRDAQSHTQGDEATVERNEAAQARDERLTPLDETVALLLAERNAALAGESLIRKPEDLPARITASTFHEFIEDPTRSERFRLRPVPQRPYRRTRVGNRFHEWVERRATTAIGTALPLAGLEDALDGEPFQPERTFSLEVTSDSNAKVGSELPQAAERAEAAEGVEAVEAVEVQTGAEVPAAPEGQRSADGFGTSISDLDGGGDEAELRPLIEEFERSRWALLAPIAVELEVTLPFAGRTLVCKLDAVYRQSDDRGGAERTEIVDWKSGRSPRTDAERESRFFQLDLYRHAYAQWARVSPELIDVSLFYVAEGIELRSGAPRSLAELETIWLTAAERLSDPARAATADHRSHMVQ